MQKPRPGWKFNGRGARLPSTGKHSSATVIDPTEGPMLAKVWSGEILALSGATVQISAQ